MDNLVRSRLMVVRGTVGLHFGNAAKQKLRLKTDGGSTYSIELFPGSPQEQDLGDRKFTMRRGNIIVNGQRFCDVPVGYCPRRGTVLVLSPADGSVIRQSTGITQDESAK